MFWHLAEVKRIMQNNSPNTAKQNMMFFFVFLYNAILSRLEIENLNADGKDQSKQNCE